METLRHSILYQSQSYSAITDSAAQYTRRVIWPLVVIGGQLLLLALSWIFFVVVRAPGQILLLLKVAGFLEVYPQSKTYLVTFMANILSTLSSYLFSQAVRHAIVLYLTRPISVTTLGFGIAISKKNLILQRREIRWTMTAADFFIASLSQTAAWSSLLTPNQIVILTPLRGEELDQSSASLNSQLETLSLDDIESYTGIVPVTLEGAVGSNTTHLLTTNTNHSSLVPYLRSFASDYSMTMVQQGLRAGAVGQYQQLNENTVPSLTRSAYLLTNTNYTHVKLAAECSNGGKDSVDAVSSTNDTLFGLACGSGTYTVIIDSQGLYSGPNGQSIVCAVDTHIMDFNVIYSNGHIYKELCLDPHIEPVPSAISSAALYGLKQVFITGQSASRNAVGDSINGIFVDVAKGIHVSHLELWAEAHIRGVIIFVGTAVKTNLSSYAGLLGGDLPKTMIWDINGTASSLMTGWQYHEELKNILMLLPITFIAIASIVIVLFAEWKHQGIPERHPTFDTGNPLLLMAAASAGGMPEIFHGLTKNDLAEGSGKMVKLSYVEEKDLEGFVQA
ncbi:hypothetical protein DFH07DRAFT_956581 [Mycena maculata]|uniref:Uncharacterized protein n=1 Tax=Mycena maculata TaxID=230809 RepID=A0AAD7JFF0_9AGAR|nr:hypothetical protein DFH07DRAFT_956581 [Mycena maculata]